MRWLALAGCVAATAGCDLYWQTADRPDARPAQPAADAAADATRADAWVPLPRICSDPAPTADVAGTTPLGAVAYQHAWPGFFGGECGDSIQVFFTAESDVDSNSLSYGTGELDNLSFWLSAPWPDGFVGRHPEVGFQLTIADETVDATGVVIIDSFEHPGYGSEPTAVLAGSLAISDPDAGWRVRGSFESVYCEHLLVACP